MPTGGAGLTQQPLALRGGPVAFPGTPSPLSAGAKVAPVKPPSPLQGVVNVLLSGGQRFGSTPPNVQQPVSGLPGSPVNAPGAGNFQHVQQFPSGGSLDGSQVPQPYPGGPINGGQPGGGGQGGRVGPVLPDPRDSTYYANVAANQFKTNSQINATALNSAQSDQALQAALAQLNYAQPRAQLGLEQRANTNNALYSSMYGQNQGNLAYQYMGKKGGVEQRYGNAIMQDALKIAGLRGGIPLYNAQQYADAATRAAILAQRNKALGQQPAFATGKVGGGRGVAANPRNGRSPGRVTAPGRNQQVAHAQNVRNLFGKGDSQTVSYRNLSGGVA